MSKKEGKDLLLKNSDIAFDDGAFGLHVQIVRARPKDSGAWITLDKFLISLAWTDQRWEDGKHYSKIMTGLAKHCIASITYIQKVTRRTRVA
jgi:hypothetical protein